ncbi:bZIP transcription factor 23-like [Andrographis paniculata]|uniref:bZIP transcription factor 23-like n=1 Tax=Andrographis paniculata TaxID=175694 RepID=UPI0021E80E6D|nr:bZIP transcription factor 23-like [Andrographis paniculata]
MNFKNFGNDPPPAAPPPLARQSSVYSLTFDEFQSTVGAAGKDFGSMNMDELLRNIWTAEENHGIGPSAAAQYGGGGALQRQGSLTLPRTLSHKTVDEVWRNMYKDGGGGAAAAFGMPHRQPTLGEITIEEFLMRAGVVREDAHLQNNLGFFRDSSSGGGGAAALGFEFHHQPPPQAADGNLPFGVNGIRSAGAQIDSQSFPKPQPQQQQHILPKQPGGGGAAAMAYGSGGGTQLSSPRMVAASNPLEGGLAGVVGLAAGGSPAALSSEGFGKSSGGDTSSVSPVPYMLSGGVRGRRSATIEKAVERRQRRMIKNRESAARSRARKQAYTMELEAEVAKLKEEQEVLQQKQAEIVEIQRKQVMEMMKQQNAAGCKRRQRLRRTQTGPY